MTPGDIGVNDFIITPLNTYTVGNVAYGSYLIMWTCMSAKESPQYANVLLNNATGEVTVGSPLFLVETAKLELLTDTYFY